MSAPLRLHYAPDNASLCVRLALEELGLPYATVLVDRRVRGQKAPEYLRLNPNGLIPTLETPDGPIFETAAILLWLADRAGRMIAAPDHPDRGPHLKWLFWLSNTLHPAERMYFYPEQYIRPDQTGLLRDRTGERIRDLFALLDRENPDWLDAAAPTVLSCYLAPLLRWPAIYGARGIGLSETPALRRFAERFELRPAAQRASRAEGLGNTPFSNPSLPNPPEGSAL